MPPPEGSFYTVSTLQTLLIKLVWNQVRMAVASGLSFQLPIPPLDSLASIAPALANLKLVIGQNHPLALRDGYLILDVSWSANLQ